MASPGKWLWRCGGTEAFFDVSHRHGTFLVTYTLTLATPKPLDPQALSTALTHLFRKVGNLRARYDTRDGHTWFREMDHEAIDFKVSPATTSIEETLTELRSYRYNSAQGPLWCARFRPDVAGPTAGGPLAGFPHVATLHLGFHHGITDGTTSMKICGFLIHILDRVLAGQHIDDRQQMGEFVCGQRTQALLDEKLEAIRADPALKERLVQETEAIKGKVSLAKTNHKSEVDADGTTKFVIKTWDEAITSSFVKRCRAEGVTVNTAFTTLAALALVDVAAAGGLLQDSYDVHTNHVVSVRRYWAGDTSPYLGCHILPPMPIIVDTPRDVDGTFWDFTKRVHQRIMAEVKAGAPVRVEAIKSLFMPKNANPDDFFLLPIAPGPSDSSDFCLSNMGDVTKMVSEGGDNVQVTHIFRSTSIHKVSNNWSHLFHTFRGRLIHVLDYNTLLVNTNMAQMFSDRLYHHLQQVLA